MTANRFRFRAWDSLSKKMISHFNVNDAGIAWRFKADTTSQQREDMEDIETMPTDRYFIMQSTGLLDKNGKEIFEGDLLEYEDEIIEIKPPEWQVIDAFCVHCRPNLSSFRDNYSIENEPSRMIREGTIIGNIYENEDLLK